MTDTKIRRRPSGDKTRRFRWLEQVSAAGVSRGARAWAQELAQHSNALAKPVWGYQVGQAARIGCSDRQVRRYRRELEEAGLIETVRGKVERRADGTFARTMTNLYRLVVGPLVRRKKASSHRPDTGVRSNPSLTRDIQTLRPETMPFRRNAADRSAEPPPLLGEQVETGVRDAATPDWLAVREHLIEARETLRGR